MRVLPAVAAALSLAILSPEAGSMSKRPEPPPKRVTGTVRVVGNEPFARTVLTAFRDGAPSDCLVEGPAERALREGHQGRVATVEGTACPNVPPGFADCIVATKILPAD